MPCYHPLTGYRSKDRNPNGKRSIVFNPTHGFRDLPVTLPCGRCIGCRLERSRQWATRIMHEASMHQENCFLTLTYSPEELPKGGTLVKRHHQLFMKRTRKKLKKPMRYFQCGEYGELSSRPHYHSILFGIDFIDKKLYKVQNGNNLYVSETLGTIINKEGDIQCTGKGLWPHGISVIGEATFESAAYVARYITKKITGPDAALYYRGKVPEYVTMSRRPGIGQAWLKKFTCDVFPRDFVLVDRKNSRVRCRPPKYYGSQFELLDPIQFSKIQAKRKVDADARSIDNTVERLKVRKKIQEYKFKRLIRNYENGT